MALLHRLAVGLLCGWILSRLAMHPGDAWLAGPAADGGMSLLVRGVVVAFVGLYLRTRGRDVGAALLFGVAGGVALHGLVLGGPLGRPTWDVLLAGVALGAVTFFTPRAEREHDPALPEPAKVAVGERIGLFLAGGGAAVALEVVARHLRLLGGGLIQDDAAFATSFALLVAVGGACFGWIAGLARLERWSAPWFAAAAAAACTWSLGTIAEVGQVYEFGRFLDRYGLDVSWHATLPADALLAGAVLVLPAFLLGIALRGARGAGSLASLLVGAGAGLVVLPRFLHHDPHASTSVSELFAAQLLPFALMTALLGAALALLSVPGRGALARWITVALLAPLALPLVLVESKPLFVLSPWERHATMPFVAFETPGGLATVEPGDGALKIATLDRRALSPGHEGVRADSQAIAASFLALPRAVRDARAVRVLLVGQLTQTRAVELARLGAARVDRTAAWHAAMPRLESALLAEFTPPAGDVVDMDEAARRVDDGRYDLCVALPAEGDPPLWRPIGDLPAGTTVVRWSRIDEPLLRALPGSRFAGSDEREPLYALAGGGLDRLMLGVLDGAARPAADEPGRIELVRLEGAPSRAWPIARLMERKFSREASATERVTGDLERWNDGPLARGLAAFGRLQAYSSPFETHSQATELDDATLTALRDTALAGPPSAFVRDAWSWLARVLAGKRDVAAIESFLAPVAARWAPWPELEVALAHADLEALDPAAAARRLAPLAAPSDAPFDVLALLGLARAQAGETAAAIAAWKRALALRPADLWTRRQLAMAQVRAGDPDGPAAVRRLLEENHEDEELRPFLGPAPWPELPLGPVQEARSH